MKTIIGSIVLTLTVPAIAQTAPAANSHINPSASQAPAQQQNKLGTADLHKSSAEMLKHPGKMHRRVKTEAERADAEVNGNGHQGHNH